MLASGARLPREPVCGQGSGGGGPSAAEPTGCRNRLPGCPASSGSPGLPLACWRKNSLLKASQGRLLSGFEVKIKGCWGVWVRFHRPRPRRVLS